MKVSFSFESAEEREDVLTKVGAAMRKDTSSLDAVEQLLVSSLLNSLRPYYIRGDVAVSDNRPSEAMKKAEQIFKG